MHTWEVVWGPSNSHQATQFHILDLIPWHRAQYPREDLRNSEGWANFLKEFWRKPTGNTKHKGKSKLLPFSGNYKIPKRWHFKKSFFIPSSNSLLKSNPCRKKFNKFALQDMFKAHYSQHYSKKEKDDILKAEHSWETWEF